MKIKSICIVMMIMFTEFAFAQKLNEHIKVFMSDGTIHVGERIYEDRNELEIKTTALETLTLDKSLIQEIENLEEIPSITKEKYHKSSGYFLNAELAINYRNPSRLLFLSSLTVGSRLNPRLHLGVGIAASTGAIIVNDNDNIENDFIHTFVYGKYNLSNKKLRFFLDMKAGLGISLVDDWERNTESGGLFLQPGIGFDIANKKKLKWSFKLSQIIQNVSGKRVSGNPFLPIDADNLEELIYDSWYNRTAACIALHF